MSDNIEFHSRKIDIIYNITTANKVKEPHFHNYYEFIYILQGRARVTVNDRVYEAGPDCLLAISNLEKHYWQTVTIPYERFCIVFKPEYFHSAIQDPVLSSVFRNRPQHFSHLLRLSPADSAAFLSLVNQMRGEIEGANAYWETYLKSLFRLSIVSLFRSHRDFFPIPSPNKNTALVLEVQKFIEDNCHNQINLPEIAREHYIDKYYLSHLFKQITGFSFKEYLILQRIAKAKELMFHTTDNVTEVALSSGFNNINHFIRIFKKYEGITPYQYRKNLAIPKKSCPI